MGAFLEWEFCLALGALIIVCGVGTWAVFKVRRWRREETEFDWQSRHELLAHYQEMLDAGDLAPEEFARIKARLDPPDDWEPPAADQPPDTSFREK